MTSAEDEQCATNGAPQDVPVPHLHIVVRNQTEDIITFKVKSTTKFRKLFQAYGAHRHKDHHRLIFVFDGMAVKGDSTPAELKIEGSETMYVVEYKSSAGSMQN